MVPQRQFNMMQRADLPDDPEDAATGSSGSHAPRERAPKNGTSERIQAEGRRLLELFAQAAPPDHAVSWAQYEEALTDEIERIVESDGGQEYDFRRRTPTPTSDPLDGSEEPKPLRLTAKEKLKVVITKDNSSSEDEGEKDGREECTEAERDS